MIKITVETNEKNFVVEVDGHANYGIQLGIPKGNDIVCASVSTLAQTLMLYADSVGALEEYEMRKGYMKIKMQKTKYTEFSIEMFTLGIQQIVENYSEFVGWGKK